MGTCNDTVQGTPTIGMFDPASNAWIVENTLSAYPDSSIVRLSDTEVRLRIAQVRMRRGERERV